MDTFSQNIHDDIVMNIKNYRALEFYENILQNKNYDVSVVRSRKRDVSPKVAFIDYPNVIKVFDFISKKVIWTYKSELPQMGACAFHPNGEYFASSEFNLLWISEEQEIPSSKNSCSVINIWKGFDKKFTLFINKDDYSINIQFSKDGKYFLAFYWGKSELIVWRVKDWKIFRKISILPTGYFGKSCMDFHDTKPWVIFSIRYLYIKLLNYETGEIIKEYDIAHILQVIFDKDNVLIEMGYNWRNNAMQFYHDNMIVHEIKMVNIYPIVLLRKFIKHNNKIYAFDEVENLYEIDSPISKKIDSKFVFSINNKLYCVKKFNKFSKNTFICDIENKEEMYEFDSEDLVDCVSFEL